MRKNFLYLILVGVLSILTACGKDEPKQPDYGVQEKAYINVDMNDSIDANVKKLEKAEDK